MTQNLKFLSFDIIYYSYILIIIFFSFFYQNCAFANLFILFFLTLLNMFWINKSKFIECDIYFIPSLSFFPFCLLLILINCIKIYSNVMFHSNDFFIIFDLKIIKVFCHQFHISNAHKMKHYLRCEVILLWYTNLLQFLQTQL